MKQVSADTQPDQQNGHTQEEPAGPATLAERVTNLEAALAGFAPADHQHGIAPEFIDAIVQQAVKQAKHETKQELFASLRKALDVLETLEK